MTTVGYDPSIWHVYPPAFCQAYCAWLETHGIDPNETLRTEHHLIDAPLIRAIQIVRKGTAILNDPACPGEPATATTDVLIRTPPPKPEDYR